MKIYLRANTKLALDSPLRLCNKYFINKNLIFIIFEYLLNKYHINF